MAVSAFKSTSRRGTLGSSTTANAISSTKGSKSEELGKKIPQRRSRSVSAVSRSYSSSSIDEFSNKRDNPLFGSANSSPDATELENSSGVAKTEQNASQIDESGRKPVGNGVSDARRGRSVSRIGDRGNYAIGARKELGRSLSRVDAGRRQRSLSRGHHEKSESENEYKYSLSSSLRNKGAGKLSSCIPSDRYNSSAQAVKWEDAVSTRSFSESGAVPEQTKIFPRDHRAGDADIYETVRSEVRRAISEIQIDLENAFRSKNPKTVAASGVADIPPELVNPDAIELVSEIRREYASKFSQSLERARKLRADLAVEEQRAQEFNRILTKMLPEPRSAKFEKPHPRRKTSIERWKMSQRLTEEAMNYFDECVSISTFDGSDFSSTEDQPHNSLAGDSAVDDDRFLPSASSSASAICISSPVNSCKVSDNQAETAENHSTSNSTITKRMRPIKNDDSLAVMDTSVSSNLHFDFIHEPIEATEISNDIRNYIKMFRKNISKGNEELEVIKPNHYDIDDYELQLQNERLLFDTVILKTRIESGSLLICTGKG